MKKNLLYMMTIFSMVFLGLCLTACGGDDKDAISEETTKMEEKDPEGTILVNLRNSGTYTDRSFHLGKSSSSIAMTESNNFTIWEDHGWYQLVSLGPVKGLGSITEVPESGYSPSVAVVPGYGYVGAYIRDGVVKSGVIRFYVVSWIENSSGSIIGASIKYQFPWEP